VKAIVLVINNTPQKTYCIAQYTDVCVFITAVPITKLFARGEGDSGGT
jgi:hypothetical protein